ncbi:MAG: hypothetical protein WKF57_22725 [Nakamurella sp.]
MSADRRAALRAWPVAQQAQAVKERIYASFTGLAILATLLLGGEHQSASGAFLTLLAGIGGISIAGFVADVIAHQVTHEGSPESQQFRTMLRIAGGAFASASIPLLALAIAWVGLITARTGIQIGLGLYFFTLTGVVLLAARRTRLGWRHQLVALVSLTTLAVIVIVILVLAH